MDRKHACRLLLRPSKRLLDGRGSDSSLARLLLPGERQLASRYPQHQAEQLKGRNIGINICLRDQVTVRGAAVFREGRDQVTVAGATK